LLSVQRLDLLDQRVDLYRSQFAAESGHAELGDMSFAICAHGMTAVPQNCSSLAMPNTA